MIYVLIFLDLLSDTHSQKIVEFTVRQGYIHLSNSTIFLNEWKTESGSNVIKSYEYSLKMKKNDFSPIINQNQSY